jgi:protocatechuate 3,4-dioxygenase beta subunit
MNRRTFVKNSTLTAFSVAAFGSLNWNGKSFEGDTETTTDILGPFYRPGAPIRSNLIPSGTSGDVLHLSGTVFQKDGKTPLTDTLVEAWQCDANEHYDNTSDEYLFRGAVKTGSDGKYTFKTIVPVPYKASATLWRPAHIHLRISSADHQDLITQIYFKGDPYLAGDTSSASPQSVNRILDMTKNSANENVVKFDVVMRKAFPLDDAGYRRITGLYALEKGNAEFVKDGDLLFVKLNGHLLEGLAYKGNNTFEGGLGQMKAKFELLANGETKATITFGDYDSANPSKIKTLEGTKFLKYTN